ncbi:class I SAM-dependent methyltransferase [Actinokineospora enzanensis]|uniref:class I SAM-dependent methyltransferase n=1 Tax=Actinokineospora enzanensis TaxID=155975 RepID=UPI000380918E|nr:class I SAM-dependent methyltransferase [Actinokineospora enzanensis]
MTEPSFLTATRAAYDTVAPGYAATVPAIATDLQDRALLTAFADLVLADGGGPVLDAGCGTGRLIGHLAAAGLDVSGVDLSAEMLAIARRGHPGLRFRQGSMLALDQPDASLAGVLAWYSTVHLPAEHMPAAFAEFARVLRPGGWLLLAFHVGDLRSHKTEGYGHTGIALDVYRQPVDRVCGWLADAGLTVDTRVLRDPDARVPQARVLARTGP